MEYGKFAAFDLEIAKVLPEEFSEWRSHRPLGITCAATLACDEKEPWLHYRSWEYPDGAEHFVAKLEPEDAQGVVETLMYLVKTGYTLVTWNGLGFDFDVLAEESGMLAECKELALHHVDLMFCVLTLRGHFLSLDAAARGMGLGGKMVGVDGAQAPALWQAGEHRKVLDYLSQDVRLTLQIAEAIEERKRLTWVSKSGRLNLLPMPDGVFTVAEALKMPEVRAPWMQDPPKRADSMRWFNERKAVANDVEFI